MKIFTFMMKYSCGIVILSIIAGLVSGIANTGLVALVHNILDRANNRPEFLLYAYIGLCLLLPLARFTSQILLTQLSQKGIFELRLQMSRQILSAPLRRLEEVGSARIMSSLTDDLFIITTTLISVPVLCMQLAVVIGCLIYMAWLSWTAFLTVLVFMALGIAGQTVTAAPSLTAIRLIALSAADQNAIDPPSGEKTGFNRPP